MSETENSKDASESLSVTDRVLTAFIQAVAAEEGYKDIAVRLNETLLVKRNFAEAALRSALFDSDAS